MTLHRNFFAMRLSNFTMPKIEFVGQLFTLYQVLMTLPSLGHLINVQILWLKPVNSKESDAHKHSIKNLTLFEES